MKKRNAWTVGLLTVFGSMTVMGSIAYADPKLPGTPDALLGGEQPTIKSQEINQENRPNRETVQPTPSTTNPPVQHEQPGEPMVSQPSVKPELQKDQPKNTGRENTDQENTDRESHHPDSSNQEQSTDQEKPKQETADPHRDSKVTRASELEQARKPEVKGKDGSSSLKPTSQPAGNPVDLKETDIVTDQKDSQMVANVSNTSTLEETVTSSVEESSKPKTKDGGKMAETGTETLPLLLIAAGLTGMGGTLIFRFGWIRL